MSLLDTFLHAEALAEILMEGHNPYALQKLDTADADALRQQMQGGEVLQGYAIGRVVGSGRGVWAVTDRAMLVRNARHQGAHAIALDQVEGFQAVRGRFGHTVRLHAQGRSWSLFGVDRALAQSIHEALAARGVRSVFEDKPAHSHVWRDAPAGWAQDCLQDARARLQSA